MTDVIAIMFYIGGLLAAASTKDAGFWSTAAWPAVVAAWIVKRIDMDKPPTMPPAPEGGE